MALLIAAGITGGAALLGVGLNMWMQMDAMQADRKEARRAEALRIKFSTEENERLADQFNRSEAFSEKKFEFTKSQGIDNLRLRERAQTSVESQHGFDNSQAVMENLMNLFNSNSETGMKLAQLNRGRK